MENLYTDVRVLRAYGLMSMGKRLLFVHSGKKEQVKSRIKQVVGGWWV